MSQSAAPSPDSAPLDPAETPAPLPLVVDLDGTLIRSDMLLDGVVHGLSTQPLPTLRTLMKVRHRGKAGIKADMAALAPLDVATLPYDARVLAHIRQARQDGRPVILATAADQGLAQAVADHLGLFDRVLASDGQQNLSAEAKATVIQQQVGAGGFEYLGNSRADLPVWRHSSRAIAVNPTISRPKIEAQGITLEAYWPREVPLWCAILRSMRLHQWAKNVLVFVPLILSHNLLNVTAIVQSLLAFLAVSFMASAVYIANDALDVQADRHHHRKRNRMIAAGHLPLPLAAQVAAGLVTLSLMVALALLPLGFLAVLLGYLLLTTAYSLALKRIEILDVLSLAGLFTVRVAAGSLATGIAISEWLASFSMFFFLSLAFLKRYIEVWAKFHDGKARGEKVPGRGYQVGDEPVLITAGMASGYVSVLILALYISSPEVRQLYDWPMVLWGVPIVLLYWLSRTWHIAHRGEIHDDPVVYALTDRSSQGLILLVALLGLLST